MKKYNKQWIAAAVALTVTVTTLPVKPVSAASSISYEDIKNIPIKDMTEEQLKVKNEYDKSIAAKYVNNYQDIEEEPPVSVSEYKDYIPANYAARQAASYDPRDNAGFTVPEARDQNPLGTCWAHSAMCMVEMNLAKNNKRVTDDMSEFQTVYFMNHDWTDPLGLCTNDNFHSVDSNSSTTLSSEWYDKGNNTSYTKFMLMDWVGAVSEIDYEDTKYDILLNQLGSASLDNSYAIEKDAAHVQDVTVINIAADKDVVKDMVLKYGSVGMSYYHDDKYYQNGCYFDNVHKNTNHAVTIVGWDDDYPASNFKYTPSGNGAWLVRNSWGSNWGDNGYFWLSYYDTSINDSGYAVQASIKGDENYYTHNYQYDGGVAMSSISYGTSGIIGANVFTAKGDETLKAVSFYTEANYGYTVDIYKNLTDNSKPDSGTKVTGVSVSGIQEFEGYHTVPLAGNVDLKTGDTFSVVVTFTAKNADKDGTVKAKIALDKTYSTGFLYSKTEALEGQSFYRTVSGNTWYDAAKENNANIRIKAYTVNSAKNPITNISFSNSSIGLKAKDTYNLNDIITLSPSNTDDSITFSSDNESVATVDRSGNVVAVRPGTAVITASAYAGTAQAEITINVALAVPAESIKLSPESLKIEKGESQKLEVSLLPEDTDDYVKEWTSSDVSAVSVDTEGNVTGVASGSAIVTAETLSGKKATCQVTVADRALGEIINCIYDKLPAKIYKYNTYIVSLSKAMEKLPPDSIIWESSSPDVEVKPSGINGTDGCVLYVKNVASGDKGEKVTLKATVNYHKVTKKKTLYKTKTFKRKATAINLSYSLTLDKPKVYITEKGARITLGAVFNDGKSDDQPTNKKLKWIITDSEGNKDKKGSRVASVSGKGVVKAKGPGTTYVTACAADSYIKKEKKYTVTAIMKITCGTVTSIGFSDTSVMLGQGGTADLKQKLVFNAGASVPYNKDGMKLVWSSSNKKNVSVNGKGVIKVAKKAQPGTYTITVKASGGVPKGETVPEGTIQVVVS